MCSMPEVFVRMIDHIDYIQAKRLKSNMKKQREQNMKKIENVVRPLSL